MATKTGLTVPQRFSSLLYNFVPSDFCTYEFNGRDESFTVLSHWRRLCYLFIGYLVPVITNNWYVVFFEKSQLFPALAPSPSQGRGIFYSLPLVCLPLDCLTLDCLTLGCLPLDCLPLDCLPLDLLALTASTACLDLMRVGLLCLLLFLCQKCS